MIYFMYICHIHLSTGTYEHIIDQLPTSVASYLSCMVRASHRYHEVTGSNPVQALDFFFTLHTQYSVSRKKPKLHGSEA